MRVRMSYFLSTNQKNNTTLTEVDVKQRCKLIFVLFLDKNRKHINWRSKWKKKTGDYYSRISE